MSRNILILTDADDVHALAVAEALAIYGIEPMIWATADFPTRAEETLHFDGGPSGTLKVESVNLSFHDPSFGVVWRRRPAYQLDSSLLHPADRAFAETECSIFRTSLVNVLARHAFWVNPPGAASRAGSKMLQHHTAVGIGLRMPETLYTNSPREVRSFIRRKNGRVVYKPFLPTVWKDGTSHFLPYTALLNNEALVEESLRLTPGIFQELVPKAYEVRLTMIGNRGFAAKLLSQETSLGQLDWRRSQEDLRIEVTSIPETVEAQCRALLCDLGLVFGCFDFIVTPNGEYIFLEVNEMGQFLFIERLCGIPLLDAFANLLIQATPDFEWNSASVRVRYSDSEFEANILEKAQAFAQDHVSIPPRLSDERVNEF